MHPHERGHPESLLSICFFLPSGRTFTFRDVMILTDNETVIVIGYYAMSVSEYKEATFQKNQFVGFSIWRRAPVIMPAGLAAPQPVMHPSRPPRKKKRQ